MQFHRSLVALTILATNLTSPALSAPDPSIIGGEVIWSIDDGDFVHPAFSPDGKMLAYADVIVDEGTEFTEVYVHEFASRKTWRLLDATDARDYAIYSAFVHRLEWISNERISASISDGDVDTTRVELDVATRQIADVRDGNEEAIWYETINKWMQTIEPLPAWKPDVLQTAFENGVKLQDGSFLIQPQYSGIDADVFRITTEGQLTQITQADENAVGGLAGALQLNDTLLFVLGESFGGNSRQADLLRYDAGGIEKLTSIATMTEPRLKPLHTDDRHALFFVSTGYSYQKSPGALYEYSSMGLTEWSAPGNLYDAEVSDVGRMLAVVYWRDERRVIEVRELDVVPATR